jgi:hypothetical protein
LKKHKNSEKNPLLCSNDGKNKETKYNNIFKKTIKYSSQKNNNRVKTETTYYSKINYNYNNAYDNFIDDTRIKRFENIK